jgi:antirestriction protein
MLNIFVNTWGNYNENGADGGEWITLPMDPDALQEELKKISAAMGDFDPEYCIHDYEWTTEIEPREISEMENIELLNEELQELDGLNEWDQKEIAAAMEAFGYEFKEAHERQQRGCFIFYAGQDLQEVAESIADECYLYNAPEFLRRYFDYAAFAHDLTFDGYTETSHGVICDH